MENNSMNEEAEQSSVIYPQWRRTFPGALLFPANFVGLVHIVIYSIFLLVYFFLIKNFPRHSVRYGTGFITFVVGVDFVGYLYHCVRESADGAVTAPDRAPWDGSDYSNASFSLGSYFSLSVQYLVTFIPIIICLLPALLYLLVTHRTDAIFAGLLLTGIFYLPIFFLAVILFDSSAGYNPGIHVISIINTFFSYCLLVGCCVLLTLLFYGTIILVKNLGMGILLAVPLQVYCLMIFSHLLGSFYYKNEDKLRWDI